MIEIENLTKRFGPITAVDGVSFRVERGTVLGFLGPNGAGKSTTMKMLTGFLHPSSGRARVCGFDVGEQPMEAKRRMGYLPEGAPLYPDMTPRGLLEFVAEVRGLGADARARIAQVVDKVQIGGVLEQRIETLSKGFKRRVGLAQAILHDPQVLVLDEPTDGLDPNQKHEVRQLIRSMAADKVIVLSTHILEEVEAVCNRVIIIAGGKLVVDCTPGELAARSSAHNSVTLSVRGTSAAALGESLRKLADVERVDVLEGSDGLARVSVRPRGGRDLSALVGACAREARWEVDELRLERGRLDDVFRELTAGFKRN
jgi:ABC-2 type transport system ATP-binding protein